MTITDPQMVMCKLCGLLVGWSEQSVNMVCIPCFDRVKVVYSTTELATDSPDARNPVRYPDPDARQGTHL